MALDAQSVRRDFVQVEASAVAKAGAQAGADIGQAGAGCR
jgi:hypothetical protein